MRRNARLLNSPFMGGWIFSHVLLRGCLKLERGQDKTPEASEEAKFCKPSCPDSWTSVMNSFYYSPDFHRILSRYLSVPVCSVCNMYRNHFFKKADGSNISKCSPRRRMWIWQEKEVPLWCPATLIHVDRLPSAPTSDQPHLLLFKEKMGSLTEKRWTIIRSQIMTRKGVNVHIRNGV